MPRYSIDQAYALLEALPVINGTTPHGFVRNGEDFVCVSGEYGDGIVEYYHPQGYPFVHPVLEQWATDRGMFWEWETCASIALYFA